jgi:1-acyl-sn-glycerol-3-phosphate acyltransferase
VNKNKGLGWFLFQAYKWFVVIPWFVALTVVFGTAAILSSYVMTPRKAAFNGVFWARLTAYAAFMRMKVIGRDNIDPSQSYVIVVNHQSAMDIIALYGWLGIDFRWVMKQEIRKVPFLGYACYRVGHVYIDRKNQAAAIQSLEAAKERIHSGTSVLFFPEGTRTESSALKPFKKGAFKMALDLGLPILPITLSGTDHVMPTKTLDLMPGKVELTIHDAIATEGMTEDDIDALMQQSYNAINASLPTDAETHFQQAVQG